jgi:murein DD-endopeptidase MepM/ murein hydrolase activator NlpD
MQSTLQKIIARFPERSFVVRSGSDTRYFVLKTWHQLFGVISFATLLLWTGVASVGFSWNHSARLTVEQQLAMTIEENQAFIAQLESDQKNAYELRQAFDDEVQKNRQWSSRFEQIRSLSGGVLNESTPSNVAAFIPWFEGQLALRVRAVEQANEDLTELVMDMSESVAEISGHRPPESVETVGAWLTDVAGDLTEAYETQSRAMEVLHDSMTAALSKGFATIDGTPLADPEFAGFSPSFGTGGPSLEIASDHHVFERFQDRSDRLMTLSQDWKALQSLLACAPLAPPVDYYNLTSDFGNRKDPFTKKPDWHEGVDLGAWPGTRVRATAPGVVTYAGHKGGYGRFVLVDHGCGIETAYGHLKSIDVKKGDTVDYRDTLGKVGSTGRSTGPHVHYEVRIKGKPVDPYQFIEAGRYVFKEQKLTVADAK